MIKALNERDSDPSSAVLAALDALQIKKNAAPTWLFNLASPSSSSSLTDNKEKTWSH